MRQALEPAPFQPAPPSAGQVVTGSRAARLHRLHHQPLQRIQQRHQHGPDGFDHAQTRVCGHQEQTPAR
jgi:hypothetical protein